MKNKIKKSVALLLVFSLLFCSFSVVSAAAEYVSGNYTYTVSGGKATITAYPETAKGSVKIPSELNGYKVTAIDKNAFFGCTLVTEIEIPDTVKSIGNYAFAYCTSLTKITIPASVTSIGNNAFKNSKDVTIYCFDGSEIHKYAVVNKIKVVVTDLKNAIIVVPGITGSELYGEAAVFGNTVKPWLSVGTMLVNTATGMLACDEYGNSKGKIWADNPSKDSYGTVMPGLSWDYVTGKATGVYTNLVKDLKAFNETYKLYDEVVFFPYDWRLTNVKSSKALHDFIEENEYDKVTLVAHSMGGIVSSNYLATYGYDKLDKLITLGTPYLGAPKALYTFETGLFLDGAAGHATSAIIKGLATNMPGIYELLPNAQYFSNGDYYVRLGDDNNLNYTQTKSYIETQEWYNSYVYSNAEKLYNSVKLKKVYQDIINKEIDAYVVVGAKKDSGSYYSTISLMNKDFKHILSEVIDDVTTGISINDILHLNDYYDISRNYGDGTVPLISATMAGADFERSPYYLDNVDHSALASDGKALQLVKNILLGKGDSDDYGAGCEGKVHRDDSFITGKKRSVSSATMKYIIIGETSTLKVVDESGDFVGEITPSCEAEEASFFTSKVTEDSESLDCGEFNVSEDYKFNFYAANSSFGGKIIYLPDETYKLSMEGISDGEILIIAQKIVDNKVVSTDVIVSDDVTSSSEMELTGSVDDDLELLVDEDGDGKVDEVVGTISKGEFKLSKNELEMTYKSTFDMNLNEEYEEENVEWTSSDTSVVTVDDEGKICAVGNGVATITATIEGTDISDTCTVTVSYAWWQWIVVILLFGWIWY